MFRVGAGLLRQTGVLASSDDQVISLPGHSHDNPFALPRGRSGWDAGHGSAHSSDLVALCDHAAVEVPLNLDLAEVGLHRTATPRGTRDGLPHRKSRRRIGSGAIGLDQHPFTGEIRLFRVLGSAADEENHNGGEKCRKHSAPRRSPVAFLDTATGLMEAPTRSRRRREQLETDTTVRRAGGSFIRGFKSVV